MALPHLGLRNEANLRRNRVVFNRQQDWRLGFGGLAGLPEAFEFVERIRVGALGLVDAALEAGKSGIGELVGVAARIGFVFVEKA
jgi:hypothetical protein